MKKNIFACFLFFSAVFLFAQAEPKLEDVFSVLDENFDKFEWVHLLLADKTEDPRPPRVKMDRLSYDMMIEDKVGQELTGKGEVMYIMIIKAGYRYDLKIDFSPKKQKGAETSRTVKNKIYNRLLIDILPTKQAE